MKGPGERKTEFLGVHFDRCDVDEAVVRVTTAAASSAFTYVVTPNVDHLVKYHGRSERPWERAYRDAIDGAGLCLNDSRILRRLARLSAIRLPVAPGSDVTRRLIESRRDVPGSAVLVGGTAREFRWLAQALSHHEVRHLQPPMGVRDDPDLQRDIARFVEGAAADISFIAIGAPQSEIVAHAIARRGNASGVALCIGASIEFLSGAKRRAPLWVQRAGLEWLFRLASEPMRLWRRYAIEGPKILGIWARWMRLRAPRGDAP